MCGASPPALVSSERAGSFGFLPEAEEENSLSIRHQNLVLFDLFSGLSNAEKLDEETVSGV
jgi:hypothetical protein